MAGYSEDLRVKVVEFLKKGHTIKETAETFGVSMKSVSIWKKMDKEGKRLVFEFVPRSPHRINHEKLLAYVKEHPDAYLREIAAHFAVGLTTNIKKRKIYKEADSEKRKKFTEFLKKQNKNRLVFIDESGIDRHLHREYCRAPKGKQVYETVLGRKFERCSIVAGKCGKEILAPFGYYGTCNLELFLKWVKEMLVPNLKKNQIVIMDNASIHKSPKIQEAIEKALRILQI